MNAAEVVARERPEKFRSENFKLERDSNHDLFHAGAPLYPLSYQLAW